MKKLVLTVGIVAPLMAQQDCWTHKEYGRTAEAVTCFTKLGTSKDPALQAEAMWGLGQYQQAADLFRAAIQSRPKEAKLYVRRGDLFASRWKPADAIEDYTTALEIEEKNTGALLGIALR